MIYPPTHTFHWIDSEQSSVSPGEVPTQSIAREPDWLVSNRATTPATSTAVKCSKLHCVNADPNQTMSGKMIHMRQSIWKKHYWSLFLFYLFIYVLSVSISFICFYLFLYISICFICFTCFCQFLHVLSVLIWFICFVCFYMFYLFLISFYLLLAQ